MATSRLLRPVLLVVVLAAAGGGWYYYQQFRTAVPAPTYNTAVIAKGSVQQAVTATGALDAVLSVDVGSQISGLIIKLHADFNSVVKKDQVIAEIDPATYKQRLRQAEADFASAKASNRLQELNTRRIRELATKSLVTQQEVDQAEAQLAQSNAQLLTREAAVENANVDLGRCTIRSPIDGIVISKQTEEGKTVAASLNAPTLFTIANDLAKMQITAAVAEADIGTILQGQAVTFTVDAFPSRAFTGTVTQVRNAPRTVSNVVTYETIINVDNRDLKLRPGMTANVSVIVASRENTLRIPNSALRVRLPEGAGVVAAAATTAPAATNPAAPGGGTSSGESRPREGGAGGPGAEGGNRRGGGGFGSDASPEQREKIRAVMSELGIANMREASPEQRERFRKVLVERGLAPAPAAAGEGVVTSRTVYRLPDGKKDAPPQAVSVKVGITDGIASELIAGSGLAEGDLVITGLATAGATSPPARSNNPFGSPRR